MYRRHLNTNTEVTLQWPIASMACDGAAMVWDESSQGVIFTYRQNGLFGIATYLDP